MKKRFMKKTLSAVSAVAVLAQLTVPGLVIAESADGTATKFVFSDSGITAQKGSYTGYKISDTALTINESGIYEVSGSCSDGSIKVKKGTKGVTVILNGIELSSKDTAPICFNKSSEVTLTANASTVNTLSDSELNNDENYSDNENAENAVIKCKDGSSVKINGSGTINITANGKNGIKSGETTEEDGEASLTVEDVTLNISAPVNDAVNAESLLNVKSGNIDISAADDALHSDYKLIIGEENAQKTPVINISSCYEGLEGANIYIYSGDININSSDDGINAANSELENYDFSMDILGGNIYVNAEKGDGLDSNGTLTVSGGTVNVFSTSSGANSPLDSDGTFKITGGTVFAVGNSGMAQTPVSGSQNYITFGAGKGMGDRSNPADDGFHRSDDNGQPPQPPEGNEAFNGNSEPPQNNMFGEQSNMQQPPKRDDNMQRPEQSNNNGTDNGQPPQDFMNNGTGQNQASTVNISSGDSLLITDSNNTSIYNASAVRGANYVFYSDSNISENETYTLNINGSAAATATTAESASTGGFDNRPNGGAGYRPNQDSSTGNTSGGSSGSSGASSGTSSDMFSPSFPSDSKPNGNINSDKPGFGFKDIENNAWYYNAINYVVRKNLMNGYSDEEFSPNSPITRAMFITVLYRMENEPETNSENTFEDVEENAYYRDAVLWANENNIAEGITENEFAPNDSITREQMAAIAYRYAKYKGMNTSLKNETTYTDNQNISSYAKEAVSWAADNNIMNGDDKGGFLPAEKSTRAQAAAVFMRIMGI